MIQVDQKAPFFSLPSSDGTTFSLNDAKGKWLVLYFYPKDSTPGCTIEACNFRDRMPDYLEKNALIYGVSVDSLKSHEKFIEKHKLPFPLLADTEKEVVQLYGVWQEKSMMGRKYWGIVRSTFLISPDGVIAFIWPKVDVANHHEAVLTKITELSKK